MRCESILDAVGGSPLVRLRTVPAPGSACVWAKLEGRNPTGSVKVRAALSMVRRAEAEGRLVAGGTLVESSSGNMAVALAMVAVTDAVGGYQSVRLARARVLARQIPGAVLTYQYGNPANPAAHEDTTGPEIVRALGALRPAAYPAREAGIRRAA